MGMKDILFDNFVILSLIVGLGVLVGSNKTFDRRSKRYFVCFICLVLFLDFADMGDYFIKGQDNPYAARYITSAIGYTLRPATLAIIINILLRRRRFNIAIWIPVFIVGVIAFTSSFTHVMFWFDEQNQFMRGPLGYLPHIVSGTYMLVLVVLTIRLYRLIDLGEIFLICYIAVICTFATVLESTMGLKFLLPGAMIVSCALYYIFLYVQTYKHDVLTGLYNRRCFYADVEKLSHQPMAVISMDLNGLKVINDSKGHQAGDVALRTFADCCILAVQKKYRVYRTGGDEFIALGKGKSADETRQLIDEMRESLKKSGYMASFGYSLYSGDGDFEDICNQADALMYEDKKRYKHRASEA